MFVVRRRHEETLNLKRTSPSVETSVICLGAIAIHLNELTNGSDPTLGLCPQESRTGAQEPPVDSDARQTGHRLSAQHDTQPYALGPTDLAGQTPGGTRAIALTSTATATTTPTTTAHNAHRHGQLQNWMQVETREAYPPAGTHGLATADPNPPTGN